MKIRPYKLSQLEYEDFSIAGYSVAGEETVIVAPEFDCVFDIGKCPREALTVNHVLLTHGHADHVAGLPYYFAQRDFQGMANGVALVPANLVKPLEALMIAWGRVEGHVPPCKFVGMKDGDEYEIRRNLIVRAFASRHIPGSLGYSIVEIRHKLKPELLGMTGPELVALKEKGVEITTRTEMPHIAYLGDTGKADYAKLPHVAQAKVLLVECTFFDDDHTSRAKDGRHIHVRDLYGMLDGMENEHIVIVHVTRRTNMSAARKLLRDSLPKEIAKKVTFMMSRKYIEDD